MTETGKTSVAFFGDYVPRQCGIATFTADLCESVAAAAGEGGHVFAVAVNDAPEGYPYGPRVHFEVREPVLADYRLAADYLNIQQVSAVCVQHEYGIYGGASGSHLLTFLRRLRCPAVVTLHTVLKQPSPEQRQVLQQIVRLADRVVVLSEVGRAILRDDCHIAEDKIVMIPHGIPDMPFVDPSFYKDRLGAEGKKVLLTFGLLSPGKGIEHVLAALPAILKKHPDVVYVILGATHPAVKREFGEAYRNRLMRTARELGLGESVLFHDRFVALEELLEYLGGADVYLTPYLNEAQVVSGTLAYALGTGKATIATPYWHAVEMLAEGRGRIVPFADPAALAEQVVDLLTNETERHAMRKRAYLYCRQMIWPQVARQYLDLLTQVREAWGQAPAGKARRPAREREKLHELPEVDLRHLRLMTDDTGLVQHCRFTTPDRRHGYCVDDNGRALTVAAMYWAQTRDESVLPLLQKYLSFVVHALDEPTRRFRTFLSYARDWNPDPPSEDGHGRALWGLGHAVAYCPHDAMTALAMRTFQQALPPVEGFTSPRAWALTILGLHAYLRRFGGDSEMRRWRTLLSERLGKLFTEHMTDDWPWCEGSLAYCNAQLPHALLLSGKWMPRPDLAETGRRALEWLVQVQTGTGGVLSLVGTNGWYVRGAEKARFDQQPVDACALVDACIEAFHVTGEPQWTDRALQAFHWFLGDNDLRTPLYDFTTGGCRDGLRPDGVNENQGAESTLSWLSSLLLMRQLQTEQALGLNGAGPAPAELSLPPAIRPGELSPRRPVPAPVPASAPVAPPA